MNQNQLPKEVHDALFCNLFDHRHKQDAEIKFYHQAKNIEFKTYCSSVSMTWLEAVESTILQ
jgi:hypothetical protein